MKKYRYSLVTGLLTCLLMTLIFITGRPAAAEDLVLDNSVGIGFQHQVSLNQPGVIEFLTPPAAGTPMNIVRDLIQERHGDLGLTNEDVASTGYVISDMYQSDHNGVTHIYLQQAYNGVRVFNAYVNTNVMPDGSVLNLTSSFIPDVRAAINTTEPTLSAAEAVNAAAAYHGLTLTEALTVQETLGGADRAVIFSTGGISLEPIPAKLVYQPIAINQVRLAWDVEIYTLDTQNYWSMRLDAHTGELLSQNDYVVHEHSGSDEAGYHAAVAHSEVTHSEQIAPLGSNYATDTLVPESYRVFAVPLESPSHGVRTLELNPYDPTASPFGWHDTDGIAGAEYTITRGNNVNADTDLDANNTPDGNAPDGGSGLVFDLPFDDTNAPSTYRPFAITNLFYWNNIIHDVSYLYGFDEVAGNFQQNNYWNGGVAGDYVRADAQDGSGTNNANFSTPPDGGAPRMQMYVWTYPLGQVVTINSPVIIAGDYPANPSNNGGTANGLTGDIVLVNDGTAPVTDGCQPIQNDITGKIGLILWVEGGCNSSVFVGNVAAAGGIAAIMIDNTDVPLSNFGGSTAIPSVAVGYSDGMAFINALQSATVNGTIDDNPNPEADRDSDIDSGVITHEYGHGISNRLTGGPSTASCLGNQEQMGEGWSDWQTIFYSTTSANNATEPRGVGTYLQFEATNGVGIRPTAYSTDMAIDPATYGNIDDGGAISIPHGLGYIWNTMLYEMYWNLVDVYGMNNDIYQNWTTGGNNLAYQLVMDGMKLQPCQPGFITGRDAILSADLALTGGDNQCLIWEGFAKRGAGFSASQGSSSVVGDETEAFDMPASCSAVPTATVAEACVGSTASFTLNVGQYLVPNVTMTGSVEGTGTSISFTPNPVTTTPSSTTANISTTGATSPGSYTATFTATDSLLVSTVTTGTVVVAGAAPAAPSLTAPADGATGVVTMPLFSWSVVSGASSYTLEVDDDSGFGSIDYTATVSGNSHTATMNLNNETTYYWRVAASNACGAGAASMVHSFTTEAGTQEIYLPVIMNDTTGGAVAPSAAAPQAAPTVALAIVPALIGMGLLPFWRRR